MEIIREKALQAWKSALHAILSEGTDFIDREQRTCREVLNLVLTITDPVDIDDPIEFMNRAEQWVYPTKEELSSIMLEKKRSMVYEYTYGPRIFEFQKQQDQINEFIIPLLKKDPSSRRAVIILYDPLKDSKLENKNIPSLMLVYFKIKDQKLHITCFIRSNDMFIGWPANIYQISVLQNYVSEKLNLSPGSLTTFSASAHIFHEHKEAIRHILKID
jgi:thymidylate synthase